MTLRWGAVLWLSSVVACGSSHSAPGVGAAVVDSSTDAAVADRLPIDADTQDAAVPDAQVADTGIDPAAIYALGECPQRPVATALPIVGMHARPIGCQRSSDCSERPRGLCAGIVYPDHIAYPQCLFEDCVTDAQCPDGKRCRCGFEGMRRCLRVDCEDDGDCAAGRQCERTMRGCDYAQLGDFVCTTPEDVCVTHQDCIDNDLGEWCYLEAGRRACSSHTCR